MATRDDFSVNFEVTPRLVDITSNSLELSVQDSHDTLTTIQDSSEGGQFEFLTSTTGGESLGGGTSVGLTTVLNNVQYAFQPTSPISVGSATTGDGVALIDSTATFVTDGVKRGDWIINFSDQSVTEVLTVDSETQITTRGLRDGTLNVFTSGDNYKLWEVAEAELSGGNFTAIDEGNSDINPLFPVFGRFITKTAASSATTQELADIQFSSFNGGVWVDLLHGASGTTFPVGTERKPCNNLSDAYQITNDRGFITLYILHDAVIDSGIDYTDYILIGQGQNLTTLTLESSATFVNTTFKFATVTGTLDGDSHIMDCVIDGLEVVSGVIENCMLTSSVITLGGTESAHFINCSSGVIGTGTPTIDMNGSGQGLAVRNYSGGLEITNKTGTDSVSIDLNSGRVILAPDVTNGTIVVRGVGELIDKSTGLPIPTGTHNGATIINDTLSPERVSDKVWSYTGS